MAIDQRHPSNTTPNLPLLPRRKKSKRIEAHTDKELDAAIQQAVDKVPEFWTIMHGVDAYMQRRKRRDQRRHERNFVEEEADPWGNS